MKIPTLKFIYYQRIIHHLLQKMAQINQLMCLAIVLGIIDTIGPVQAHMIRSLSTICLFINKALLYVIAMTISSNESFVRVVLIPFSVQSFYNQKTFIFESDAYLTKNMLRLIH